MPRFTVTTPIYYVNALPHLGTFYTTVVADALARFHRAAADRTFFLTGVDEHGQKIERIARERGMEPQAYCDEVARAFLDTWSRAEISQDDFIRTTQERHRRSVTEMWERLRAAGDIYLAAYDGMYCVGCEDWKSEDDVVVEDGEKVCPIHRRPVERVKEENYFFRLSRYAPALLDLYETGFVRPESRRNEVASFVRGGLKDISVSRMKRSVSWGIAVPGDPEHVIYVWVDALTNYVTALGGPRAVAAGGESEQAWAACHHLIAKDILRFHAVYWPAMLMSAGLPTPAGVFCHGYLTVKGEKISKSLPATKVDPIAIAEDLGVDAVRYFILREYTFGGDGDFTYEALLQRYESDLGNDLGNLLNRTVSMAHQFLGGTVPPTDLMALDGELGDRLRAVATDATRSAEERWRAFQPAAALEATWQLVRHANRLIDETKPWKLAKQPPPGAGTAISVADVLGACCETLRITARLIAPAMPATAGKILEQLGQPYDAAPAAARWPSVPPLAWPGGTLGKAEPLFPRFDADRKAALVSKWLRLPPDPATTAAATTTRTVTATTPGATETMNVEKADFDRLDLRAAKVVACERVPKTDKLLKLTLDIGTERRTVISGIAGAYPPESMLGRTVVYLANLAPAKIRGVVSQGMILAAGDARVLALAALDQDVPPGTRIR